MTAARAVGSTGRRVVVAVAVAEGIEYAVRLMQRLRATDTEIHLVVAPAAERALGSDLEPVLDLAKYRYAHDNQAARIASGSYLTEGMVIVPCDANVLSAIGMGLASDLLLRAADVTLKESRPLVLGLTPSAASELERTELPTDLPGLTVVTLSRDVEAAIGSIVGQLAGSTD